MSNFISLVVAVHKYGLNLLFSVILGDIGKYVHLQNKLSIIVLHCIQPKTNEVETKPNNDGALNFA